jgi:hypothetical protein
MSEAKFIAFKYTQAHCDEAREIARYFGQTKHPNHTGGDSRARGMLAEIVFTQVFSLAMPDRQFRQDYKLGPHLINVKSNHCRVYPKTTYDVRVLLCDLVRLDHRGIDFVFVQLSFEMPVAYIVGWLSVREFVDRSRLVREGEPCAFGKCRTDMRVLRIDGLNPMDTLQTDGNLFTGEFCLPLDDQ